MSAVSRSPPLRCARRACAQVRQGSCRDAFTPAADGALPLHAPPPPLLQLLRRLLPHPDASRRVQSQVKMRLARFDCRAGRSYDASRRFEHSRGCFRSQPRRFEHSSRPFHGPPRCFEHSSRCFHYSPGCFEHSPGCFEHSPRRFEAPAARFHSSPGCFAHSARGFEHSPRRFSRVGPRLPIARCSAHALADQRAEVLGLEGLLHPHVRHAV